MSNIVRLILEFNQLNQEGKGLNILKPNQVLSILPISLAQLKVGNNSEKLKNEIRKLLPNNKNIVLVNLSIYYPWKNINSEYNNNKFKISAPTWNDEFDLLDGSYSIYGIQDYSEFIIKNNEALAENSPVQFILIKSKTGLLSK